MSAVSTTEDLLPALLYPPNYRLGEHNSNYFSPLQQHDPEERKASSHWIVEELWESAESPVEERQLLCRVHLRRIARLAWNCPFEDVRTTFQKFLADLGSKLRWNLSLLRARQPSCFCRMSDVAPVDPADPVLCGIFKDIFVNSGRVLNTERLMGWHPQYLAIQHKAFNVVMRQPGPLPLAWRHYLAIMGAAAHGCEYLVRVEEEEFCAVGGDVAWLGGLEHAPQKIARLQRLNAVLAHKPFILNKNDIADLVGAEGPRVDMWSLAELVHAIVVLCTFHSLCGFVNGCGVLPEQDHADLEPDAIPMWEPGAGAEAAARMDALVDLLKKSHAAESDESDELDGIGASDEEAKKVELFVSIDEASTTPTMAGEREARADARQNWMAKYLGTTVIPVEDFDIRRAKSDEYHLFRAQDYSWTEHGYSLVSQYYSDAAPLLDREFDFVYNMTDSSIGTADSEVDTLPFRRAVWFYAHRTLGVFHDDYDYKEPNTFLNKDIKNYVKKVAMRPEDLTYSDFDKLGSQFRLDEKCHINLLASESRKQAQLLYGLHAVMRHMMPSADR